jgi:hypothetical protein
MEHAPPRLHRHLRRAAAPYGAQGVRATERIPGPPFPEDGAERATRSRMRVRPLFPPAPTKAPPQFFGRANEMMQYIALDRL